MRQRLLEPEPQSAAEIQAQHQQDRSKFVFWSRAQFLFAVGAAFLITSAFLILKLGHHDGQVLLTPSVALSAGLAVGFSYNYEDSNGTTVMYGWRGIPFAQPPVGPLRWAPPQKALPFPGGHMQLTAYPPPCAQSSVGVDGSVSVIGQEDCLYVNVYTTVNPSVDYGQGGSNTSSSSNSSSLYPVLFFIYGGGLMGGAANASFDSLLASFSSDASEGPGNAGLTVVEVSYRLNAFGFLATEELSQEANATTGLYTSGNYGIQDQILALEWTRDNIARFGGDPLRVTIAGQSSGGTSVFALLAAKKNLTHGLFSAGISMSGSPNITMSLAAAERQNANFSSDCLQGNNSAATVACMRSWAPVEVLSRVPGAWNTPGIWNLPASQRGQGYQGVLIVDGYVIPAPFVSALGGGGGADVPLMLGNMECEADEGPELVVSNYSQPQWQALLNSTFGPWSYNASSFNGNSDSGSDNLTAFGLGIAAAIGNLYRPYSAANPQKAYDAIVSDYGLYCAQVQLAKKAKSTWYADHGKVTSSLGNYQSDVYVYEDTWALSQTYVSPWAGNTVQFAFHDTFYFMVTGQWNLIGANDDGTAGEYVPSPQDLQGSRFLQSLWRPFLRNSSRAEIATVESGQRVVWQPVNADKEGFSLFSPTVDESGDSASAAVGAECYTSYSVFVIANTSSATTRNHRQDICKYYNSIGLDRPEYWWVN